MTPAVFAHGHLRLYLLNLLDENSMHGYELIQALDERFGGTYKPSAGTIYPRLAKLEAEGLVTKTADGRKSTYAITAAGRSELEARRSELDAIETDVTDSVRRLADEVRASVNGAMKSLRADLASAAREARNDANRTVVNSVKVVGLDSRAYLQEAEILLSDFRHQLRTDLRERVQHDKLTAETVSLLKQQLKDVREAVKASLRS
jgi:DNA-binding PadR family transcriptional regulator